MRLEPLKREHASDFARWIGNKDAVKYSLSAFAPSRDESWVWSFIGSLTVNDSTWDQVIVSGKSRIGYCGLCNISMQNRSAQFYILIGDSQFWGLGIGTEAGGKILEYGFKTLGLNRIWLTVSSSNVGAVRSYEKLGFTQEGIMRQAAFRDGQYHDKVVMGMLRNEMHNKSKLTEMFSAAPTAPLQTVFSVER